MQTPSSQEKLGAVCCHLIALLASSLLLGIVAPLVVMAIFPNSQFVKEHGKQAINFQINLLIWAAICFVLCFVLIGFIGFIALAIYACVMPIIACIYAAAGDRFHYPLTFGIVS